MAKSQYFTSVAAIESQPSISLEQKSLNQKVTRFYPWPFVLLMLLMLACMGASACIIIISDGQPVKSWKVEPPVLLAVISSIWNYATGAILSIAVTITWWRNFQRGTTIRNLHYIWTRGAGFSYINALRAGVDSRNIVLLATLVVLMQAFNNPILQQASHVRAKNIIVTDNMKLKLVSLFPEEDHFRVAEIQDASKPGTTIQLRPSIAVAQAWWLKTPMLTRNATDFRCDGVCNGKVKGTGLKFNCNSTTTSMNLLAPGSGNKTVLAMSNYMTWNATGAPRVILKTVHASAVDSSCIANITIDECIVEAALVEYPILVQGNEIALDQSGLDNITVIADYISPGDLRTTATGAGAGPLQSTFRYFSYLKTDAILKVRSNPGRVTYHDLEGNSMADYFLRTEDRHYPNSTFHRCSISWDSPTTYAKHFMHEAIFRSLLQASNDSDIQTFEAQRSSVQLVFRSNYNYLIGVLVAMLLVLLGSFSQLWAWWELGWNMTLSPIETAKAFGAPALQQDDERSALKILRTSGNIQVIHDKVHGGRVLDMRVAPAGNFF